MARSGGNVVAIDGHRIRLTHPEKVLYPRTQTTKAEVIAYYVAIAGVLLPHVADRAATRKRWVEGVGTEERPGEVFFEKNLPSSAPRWIRRVSIQHKDHRTSYAVVDQVATLAWLGQMAALEIHVPQWTVGEHGAIQPPDRFVLDLDPGPGAGLPECVKVARTARDLLADIGLETVPVTSGSKGLHLYAGLDGSHDADYVNAFAKQVAETLENERPELVVSTQRKSLRGGKVLADWSQNNPAKTTIAPYSLRGRDTPTVAVPRTWDELDGPDLRQLTLDEVLERMQDVADPMASLGRAVEVPTAAPRDRLEVYRSMRDPDATPEPVPTAAPATSDVASGDGGEPIFVIQEHHASRLHWDFRLEHDGVLVSWALPKGVPSTTTKNHLAVPTEDHPIEYATFEGTIPAGEYGGGEVTIWDSGTYTAEKWRDSEVIATLTGHEDGGLGGTARFALIRTGENWLIHRMELPGSRSSSRSTSRSPDSRSSSVPRRPIEDVVPMLATRGTAADLRPESDWAFEMKWDGVRVIAVCDGEAVRLVSRTGNDNTTMYPEVVEALTALGLDDSILDGEVVALADGRPSFGRLQHRMGLTKPADVSAARRDVPVEYLVFDVLRLDGQPARNARYDERRRLLDDLDLDGGVVRVPEVFDGGFADAVETSRSLGLEGVLAKRRASRYRGGTRSSSWLKIKHQRMQEVVIVGWRPGRGRRAGGVGSLLVAVPDASGALRYAGRVGTGFSDRALDDLGGRLDRLARRTPAVATPPEVARDAQWVTARLVAEVSFGEWTDDGQLRHPVWRGLRPDKIIADLSAG